jgi:hypothetical protein
VNGQLAEEMTRYGKPDEIKDFRAWWASHSAWKSHIKKDFHIPSATASGVALAA